MQVTDRVLQPFLLISLPKSGPFKYMILIIVHRDAVIYEQAMNRVLL
jgi:hypothetical protein